MLAAVGIAPTQAFAQEKKPEKMVCKFGRPTYGGYHTLNLHLENSQPSKVSAQMRFDLDGMEWWMKQIGTHGIDPREFGITGLVGTNWSSLKKLDIEKRQNALKEVQDLDAQATIQALLDNHSMDVLGSGTGGWIDLNLSTVPNGGDQLFPKTLSIQIPPLGKYVGLANAGLKIIVSAGDNTLFEKVYNLQDVERRLDGTGPAPFVSTDNIQGITSFIQAAQQGSDVTVRVVSNDDELFYYSRLAVGFEWNQEFSTLMSMSPKLRPKMQAFQQGDRTNCEKDACFLTTATVEAIGLADDCWELQTLRAYRDKTLCKSKKGKSLIQEYYDIAPKIVSDINDRPDAKTVWYRTYLFGILPTALFARFGWNKLALRSYRRMTMSLGSKFNV